MRNVRRMLVPLLLVAVLPVLAAADENGPPSGPPRVQVTRETLSVSLTLEGTLEPAGAAEIRVEPEAYNGALEVVETIDLFPGTEVAEGEVLVRFDAEPVEQQLSAARRDLATTEARLEQLRREIEILEGAAAADRARAEQALDLARDKLVLFEEQRRAMTIESNELDVQRTRDGIDDLEEELAQLQTMYAADELTDETEEFVIARTERRLERARAGLALSEAELVILRERTLPQQHREMQLAVASAEIALARLQAQQPTAAVQQRTELEKTETGLADLEERIVHLEGDLERMTVRAPAGGRIFPGSFRNGAWQGGNEILESLAPGRTLPSGRVLFTIVVPDAFIIRAKLPEEQFVHVGAIGTATLAIKGLSETTATATLDRWNPVLTGQGVEIEFAPHDLPEGRCLPGMRCTLTAAVREIPDALVVPSAAVRTEGGTTLCWVVRDGEATSVEVTTGTRSDGKIEIVEGLSEGDTVLLLGGA